MVKALQQSLQLDGLAHMSLCIPGSLDSQPATAHVQVTAWLTDNFEPKLLLGNEFLHPHRAIINLPPASRTNLSTI
jgi:hypothetical protein